MADEAGERVGTVSEIMSAEDKSASRGLIKMGAGMVIAISLLFTGYFNVMLYGAAFPDNLKILAFIPVIILEGSLALFLLGNFVWFSSGTQGLLAKIFGWVMFGIVGLNVIIAFNEQSGNFGEANDFLKLYAFWGVPFVIVLVIGFWKAVLDADPTIKTMRLKRKMAQTLEVAKLNAVVLALGSNESREALVEFGENESWQINQMLRGQLGLGAGHKKTTKQAVIEQPAETTHKGEAQDAPSKMDNIRSRLSEVISPNPTAPMQTMASDSPAPVTSAMDYARKQYESLTPEEQAKITESLKDPNWNIRAAWGDMADAVIENRANGNGHDPAPKQ
jgi:hypothetical protein